MNINVRIPNTTLEMEIDVQLIWLGRSIWPNVLIIDKKNMYIALAYLPGYDNLNLIEIIKGKKSVPKCLFLFVFKE